MVFQFLDFEHDQKNRRSGIFFKDLLGMKGDSMVVSIYTLFSTGKSCPVLSDLELKIVSEASVLNFGRCSSDSPVQRSFKY